jgi:hypothetical protein
VTVLTLAATLVVLFLVYARGRRTKSSGSVVYVVHVHEVEGQYEHVCAKQEQVMDNDTVVLVKPDAYTSSVGEGRVGDDDKIGGDALFTSDADAGAGPEYVSEGRAGDVEKIGCNTFSGDTLFTSSSDADADADVEHNKPAPVTYHPGQLVESTLYPGLCLSKGLQYHMIAQSAFPVKLYYPEQHHYFTTTGATAEHINTTRLLLLSKDAFHIYPDAAAVFEDTRDVTGGGWIYVIYAEDDVPHGGVGALTFNADGRVIDYERLLTNDTPYWNCGGGKTP